MTLLVITDAIKTLMMIIGVVVVIRFMKNVFATKHAAESIKAFDAKKKAMEQEKLRVEKNQGKISITPKTSQNQGVEDVDFEEVK
jgi:hypothetical protein